MIGNPTQQWRLPDRIPEGFAVIGVLAVAVALCWQAVTFVALLRAPTPMAVVTTPPRSATGNGSLSALFGAQDATLTDLPAMVLRASFVNSDPALSSAILVAGDGPGRLVQVGDEVVPGVLLVAAAPDHAVLGQGTARLHLPLRPTAPSNTTGAPGIDDASTPPDLVTGAAL